MTEVRSQQSVWLYTRDPESVRLAVQPGPAGFQLVIFGPGNASAEFDFAEMKNLDLFREKYEQDLLARGFTIQATAERRTDVGGTSDRMTMPRSSTERRRG